MSTFKYKNVTGATPTKTYIQDFGNGTYIWIRLTTGNPTTGTTNISGASESSQSIYDGIRSEFNQWLADGSHPPSSPN